MVNGKNIPKKGVYSPYFDNNTNLKEAIQKRIVTDFEFDERLKDITGDLTNTPKKHFNDLVLDALRYFFCSILNESNVFNHWYSLEGVKGLFDKNYAESEYIPLYKVAGDRANLKDASYLKECYLILNFAWYQNRINPTETIFFKYLYNYATTGEKLPENEFKGDIKHLNRKYKEIDKAKRGGRPPDLNSKVKYQFFAGLFLICKECGLPTDNFKISYGENKYREFNPMVKTARPYRKYFPFKLLEYDIKCANPTFIDLLVNSNLKDEVYSSLQKNRGIDRETAKELFNTYVNSGEYNSLEKQKEFFLECGYNEKQAKELAQLTKPTPEGKKMYDHMTSMERGMIEAFVRENKIRGFVRLHDAVIVFDKAENRNAKSLVLTEFSKKELNQVIQTNSLQFKNSFVNDNRYFIGAIPERLYNETDFIFKRVDKRNTKKIFTYEGFDFYDNDITIYSCNFNINENGITESEFIEKIVTSFKILRYLNPEKIDYDTGEIFDRNYEEIEGLILAYIYSIGSYSFNLEYLKKYLSTVDYNKVEVKPKYRDYEFKPEYRYTINQFNQTLNRGKRIKESKIKLSYLLHVLKEPFPLVELKDLGYSNQNQNVFINSIRLKINDLFFKGFTASKARKYEDYLKECYNLKNTAINDLLKCSKSCNIFKNRTEKHRFEKWLTGLNLKQANAHRKELVKELERHLENVTNYQIETINHRLVIIPILKPTEVKIKPQTIDINEPLDLSNSKLNEPISKTINDHNLTIEKLIFQYGLDKAKIIRTRKKVLSYLDDKTNEQLDKIKVMDLLNIITPQKEKSKPIKGCLFQKFQ